MTDNDFPTIDSEEESLEDRIAFLTQLRKDFETDETLSAGARIAHAYRIDRIIENLKK